MGSKTKAMAQAEKRSPRVVSRQADTPGNVVQRTTVRSVAVTGAASVLGSDLLSALEDDPTWGRIVAIDIQSPTSMRSKSRFYEVDLTDARTEARLSEILAAEKVDTLVHLAFLASPTHAHAWTHEFESIGTGHTLAAARAAGVRAIVSLSQTWLYGARGTNPNYLRETHPLLADATEPYFRDKLEAEAHVQRLLRATSLYANASNDPSLTVTVLRAAPILGPRTHNFLTRYFGRKFVPTILGYDPLIQVLDERDAVRALRHAVRHPVSGIFNIASEGVLRLSKAIHAVGKTALPLPYPAVYSMAAAGWLAQLTEAPPSFLRYLRHMCVADTGLAKQKLGFEAHYSALDALVALRTLTAPSAVQEDRWLDRGVE